VRDAALPTPPPPPPPPTSEQELRPLGKYRFSFLSPESPLGSEKKWIFSPDALFTKEE